MGYKIPKFNVWCQVKRAMSPNPFGVHGWSRCQVRGMDSHADPTATVRATFEVLFPKYSDVRDFSQSPDGLSDWIQVAGWGNRFANVQGVSDKGGGFFNEYRIAVCIWVYPFDTPLNTVEGCGVIDTTLEPPGGYTPLPLITPEGWAFTD